MWKKYLWHDWILAKLYRLFKRLKIGIIKLQLNIRYKSKSSVIKITSIIKAYGNNAEKLVNIPYKINCNATKTQCRPLQRYLVHCRHLPAKLSQGNIHVSYAFLLYPILRLRPCLGRCIWRIWALRVIRYEAQVTNLRGYVNNV